MSLFSPAHITTVFNFNCILMLFFNKCVPVHAVSSLQDFQPMFCEKHLFPLCPLYPAHLIHLDSSSEFSKGNTHRKYPARRSTVLTQENAAICSSVILFNHLSCDSHRPVMKVEYIHVTASPWEKTFSLCNVRSTRQFDRNATLHCHSGYSVQRRDGASQPA
jgi:hypothetical protein